MTWAERAAERSPVVRRSRSKGVEQARTIVQAAQRLIETKGPSFTTQELIKEAGIALQTFYRYFPGKDQLLLAVIEDIIDENCEEYREEGQQVESDPVDRLRYYVDGNGARAGRPAKAVPASSRRSICASRRSTPTRVSHATRPYTDLLVEEIREASAIGDARRA